VPKSHVYRVLRSGEVRVNSGRVKPEYRLQVGDRVRVPPVRLSEKKPQFVKPLALPVAFEDAALIVIDKPSGVAVHGGSGVSHGVIESLRAERPQAKFLELVHRLDRDTSGLLLVAKKRAALVELHRMLREGEVEKDYLAVVKGVPAKREFEIRESLHKYVTSQGERRVAVREDGKAAVTRARLLKAGPSYSLLELRLLTGRTHQIRVHLAHAGHPLLFDHQYRHGAQSPLIGRTPLHAAALEWRSVKIECPLPGDIEAAISALR